MPIIDVEIVCVSVADSGAVSAHALADALGETFGSPPGRTWVRLHYLDSRAYAENAVELSASELPVFVTVLHAHPPEGAARETEAMAVTKVVANCIGCPPDRVHIQYAPPGAGRQAFGGTLVE
jgi:phenylpyruvate tautomerase PptA (4-oxalocrotonate tautomerase family)